MTTTDRPAQLTIYGEAVPYPLPAPRHLTERQRDLLRWLAVMYEGATFPTGAAGQFFVDPSGALRRLEAIGRVRRIMRGRWKTT